MKKLNQNGFSPFEILLLVLVLAALGFAGYVVYQRGNDPVASNQTVVQSGLKETPKVAERCESAFTEFKSEKLGVSFCYPEGWNTEVMDMPSNHLVGTVSLKSPDYEEDRDAAYGGSKTGSAVAVIVYASNYTSTQSILDGTEQSKVYFSDIKATKVAGFDGATFISGYEGPRNLVHQFEHSGKQYSISLSEDLNGPNFNDNQAVYVKIVNSFKLISD
jgi:hypothetical protein